jgi:hypothetical protein
MADSPRAVQRRIRWIVAPIVFMLALAALYVVMMRHHPHRHGPAAVNLVTPAS